MRAAATLALLALTLLPPLPASAAVPGPPCAIDEVLCPPRNGVVATCRSVGIAVVGPDGLVHADGVATAAVAKGAGHLRVGDAAEVPVAQEVQVGDVRIIVHGLRTSCGALYERVAPTVPERRAASASAWFDSLDIITPAGALVVPGLAVNAWVHDTHGMGPFDFTTCRLVIYLYGLPCMHGAGAYADHVRIAVAQGWAGVPGADPGMRIRGIAAVQVTVDTPAGVHAVYIGAATAGVLAFPLPTW